MPQFTPVQQTKIMLLGIWVNESTDEGHEGTYYVIRNGQELRNSISNSISNRLLRFKTVDEAIAAAAAPHKVGGVWK